MTYLRLWVSLVVCKYSEVDNGVNRKGVCIVYHLAVQEFMCTEREQVF